MITKLFRLTRGFGAALALALGAAQAQAVPLTDLLNGQSIEIGDKRFDSFMLVGDPVDPVLSDPIDLSAIDVTGIGDGTAGNAYGLNFEFGAEFTIGSEAPDTFDFMDLFFAYTVTVTTPGNLINGISLVADATATGSDAFVEILKEAFDSQPVDLLGGPMEVFSDTLFADNLSESRNITPSDTVFVGDNIALFFDTSDGPSLASLTSFEQRFSQITTDIPVPATLLLVLMGLFGLRVAGRRA